MANDVENRNNEIDDENINIDDIEGLERDFQSKEENNNPSANNSSPKNEENEPLEILQGGKLKTATSNDETTQNASEQEDSANKLKNKKAIKILLAILLTLIIGIIAFVFLSSTEENIEEKPPVETVQTTPLPPIETYEFKLDHINVSRLNKKLENLSKYELLGMTEEEYLKEEKIKALKKAQEEEALKEKMRLEQEALEKEALEKARLGEELAKKTQQTPVVETKSDKEETPATKPSAETPSVEKESQPQSNVNNQNNANLSENNGNEFLKFVQINTHQKAIYKTYLKKIQAIDMRINACRNINKNIEVFIGPLKNDENYTAIIEAIKQEKLSTDVVFIEVTKEEFAKRCMVEEN